jgi:glycosyltransferase involved in cell wall biosynthesis
MKVAVVTPTIGGKYLKQCVESVQKQTYKNLTHYIFIDGCQYRSDVKLNVPNSPNIRYIDLEENIGKEWYGHRVYAACSFLVNADVIVYLDPDNWIEPTHVESLVNALDGNDWAYSLRKIYDKEGNYLCNDNCESLGKWPVFFNDDVFLVDTSCYAVRRDVAVSIGHAWYRQWGADRQFFSAVAKYFPRFTCTGEYTTCYRLDGNPNSVKHEFFDQGNMAMSQKYAGKFPWNK